jgi:aldehyde dehydrogenase (NAD+)
MSACAADIKRLTLELGGKSANIVFADADLERAAAGAQAAIFAAAGQSCTAGSRLLVQRRAHDALLDLVARGAERLRLGPPGDAATEVGPIQNARQHARLAELIAAGTREGAELVTGGGRPDGPAFARGYYVAPTVLAAVKPEMTVAREEIFGPVLAVTAFDDEDEAVALANDVSYGLAAAVWTSDLGRAHRVASKLEAGTVWVNTYGDIDTTV